MSDNTLLDMPPAPVRRDPDNSQAKALVEALRSHYLKPGEVYPGGTYLTEVRAPGEGGTVRLADAVFVGYNTIATRTIEVCEIKTSRADLMREIDNPAKTAAWWPYCSKFWVVSPSPTVTPPDILPDGWGLMCPKRNGRRFQVHKEPTVRTPMVDFDLLMVLAKKIELGHGADLHRAKVLANQQAELRLREWRRELDTSTRVTPDMEMKLSALAAVEQLSGLRLVDNSWLAYGKKVSPQDLAAALSLVNSHNRAGSDLANLDRKLREAQDAMKSMIGRVQAGLEAHTKLDVVPPVNGCVCKLAAEVV